MRRETRRRFLFLRMLILLIPWVMSSCTKNSDLLPEVVPATVQLGENAELTTGGVALTERLKLINEPVFFYQLPQNKSGSFTKEDEHVYALSLVAEVDVPKPRLSASFVQLVGDQVVVGYHTQGSEYSGGIDLIDLSIPNEPRIVSSLFDQTLDVNAVSFDAQVEHVDGVGAINRIWIAGATNERGAELREAWMVDGKIYHDNVNAFFNQIDFESASANSVTCSGNILYVTGGGTRGGIYKVSANEFTLQATEELPYAKYVSYSENMNRVVAFQGTASAQLCLYHTDLTLGETISVGDYYYPNQQESASSVGKSTIYIDDKMAWVSMGAKGLKAFDLTQSIAEPVYTYVPINGNVNGVSFFDNMVLVAGGADGFILAEKPAEGVSMDILGAYNPEGSVNFVAANDEFIVLACGTGGVKILRKEANSTQMWQMVGMRFIDTEEEPYFESDAMPLEEGEQYFTIPVFESIGTRTINSFKFQYWSDKEAGENDKLQRQISITFGYLDGSEKVFDQFVSKDIAQKEYSLLLDALETGVKQIRVNLDGVTNTAEERKLFFKRLKLNDQLLDLKSE